MFLEFKFPLKQSYYHVKRLGLDLIVYRDQYDDDCRVNDTINMGMLLMRLGGKIML
ncbi:unnamed protein product [Brassica oleracea var. botrytis]